jgi:N-acetylmuramic acid 6-phosphate etherase
MFHDSKGMESRKRVLGIEGGGTKTDWVLLDGDRVVRDGALPAANLRLVTDTQLAQIFSVLPGDATHVGAFLAGCVTPEDHARLERLARTRWPDAEIAVGGDRESGFATAFGERDGILVIAGTGSAVTGRRGDSVERAGGWGHVLGDNGSGYALAMHALRRTLFQYDIAQEITSAAEGFLRALALNQLKDLVAWAATADKMAVATLAPVVFKCAKRGDAAMLAAVQNGARDLVQYTRVVARRLGLDSPEVRLMGGMFVHHPEYAGFFHDYLSDELPRAHVSVCAEAGALGAAWLAARGVTRRDERGRLLTDGEAAELSTAATEQVNPRSANLDRLSPLEMVDLFAAEERFVGEAVQKCRVEIAAGIELIAGALRSGGRLFYAGAGTSGRLGVLDASEIPPTFGAPPEMVQGIIAGGAPALHSPVEGAEDHAEAGALAVVERGVTERDVVCGITASGRTPFVLGALRKARELGATTILLSCNPERRATERFDVEIDLPTGPELVTGSTRLKAGTATKVTLNILSTCSMVLLGHVQGNAMVDVRATNAKLRDRAARLVMATRRCSHEEAVSLLEAHRWNVRECDGE